MKSLKKKKLVNHVVYLVDCSGSMYSRLKTMEKMLTQMIDKEVQSALAERQDTRISVYAFGDGMRILSNNQSVADCPTRTFSLFNMGGTSLISSTMETVASIGLRIDPKNDNAVILRVITDGQETQRRHDGHVLKAHLDSLNDDWTVAILVPDKFCEQQAIAYGFPEGNIEIWDATSNEGVESMALSVGQTTQSFYSMRSSGQKSTKSLFKLKEVNKTEVKKALEEVSPSDYQTLIVRKYDDGKAIKDFVESWTKEAYRLGSAYYQLTKPEKIQAGKIVAVVDKQTGKMFSGLNARKLLGLPNAEVKVEAAAFTQFDVFVQSHSPNRKLVGDTHLIVFK